MMFEEKKQEIIDTADKIAEHVQNETRDKGFIYQALKVWIVHELNKLQPDKPRCSTCKYLMQEQDELWCGFKKSPIIEFHMNFKPENFGCIYHDQAQA